MRRHKLNTTRPEFLLEMMSGGDIEALSMDNLRQAFGETSNALTYCVYTVLMDADIKKEDIVAINNDGESLAITMRSKAAAKDARDLCHRERVDYGWKSYMVTLKVRDKYLIAKCVEIPKEEPDDINDQ